MTDDELREAVQQYMKGDHSAFGRYLFPDGINEADFKMGENDAQPRWIPRYTEIQKRMIGLDCSDEERAAVQFHLLERVTREADALTAQEEILSLPNTLDGAKRADELAASLPDYYRVGLVSWLWDDNLWNYDCPAPLVWAAVLKMVHGRGRTGSLVMQNFGVDTLEEMFGLASWDGRDGLYADGDPCRPILDGWRKRRVYRGGRGDPAKLAEGMSWTLSLKEAIGFMERGSWGDGKGIVIAARIPKNHVLAVFDNESEVVVIPREREYEIAAWIE